jgi:hypothetical protein
MPEEGSMRWIAYIFGITLFFGLVGGCCTSPDVVKMAGSTAMVTSADQRTIIETQPKSDSKPGRVSPSYLHCAEPSPDIALAVSKSFNLGASLDVQGLKDVDPKLAFAVSSANAQAIAQLTERLATIQLLRDGLYRACEAYENGAISDTTYAVMLSRVDKLMVTMLLGELSAGAFGRSLAVLTTEASRLSPTPAETVKKPGDESGSAGGKTPATSETGKKPRDRSGVSDGQAADSQKVGAKQDNKKDGSSEQKATSSGTTRTMGSSLSAQSTAQTSEANAVGGIAVKQSAEIAQKLAEMQRKYVENLNFDVLEVACITALDRDKPQPSSELATAVAKYTNAKKGEKEPSIDLMAAAREADLTPLAAYCLTDLLPEVVKSKKSLVNLYISRATAEKERAEHDKNFRKVTEDIGKYVKAIKEVLDAYSGLAKPASDTETQKESAGSSKTSATTRQKEK